MKYSNNQYAMAINSIKDNMTFFNDTSQLLSYFWFGSTCCRILGKLYKKLMEIKKVLLCLLKTEILKCIFKNLIQVLLRYSR